MAQNRRPPPENGGRFNQIEPLPSGAGANGLNSSQASNYLGMSSPDHTLNKNSKAQAMLAPLNHFSPAMQSGEGVLASKGSNGQLPNMPSLEQL